MIACVLLFLGAAFAVRVATAEATPHPVEIIVGEVP